MGLNAPPPQSRGRNGQIPKDLDLLTLARTARTSVEMIDRFYASSLTAELNRDKLHSFRRPTRFLTDGVSPVITKEG